MTHIATTLREDHQMVERLLGDIVLADDSDGRTKHFRELKAALKAGMLFKEQELYPVLTQNDEMAAFVVKVALGDHLEIGLMIDRLERTNIRSSEFLDLLLDLEEALEAHRRFEKEEIFSYVYRTLGATEAERLSRRQETFLRRYRLPS